jgi:hypothetical protein
MPPPSESPSEPSRPAARRTASSLEAFDATFRKRLTVALAVSLVVNAVIFGTAGVTAHRFLQSLLPKPQPITVTRIVLPANKDVKTATPGEIAAAIAEAKAREARPAATAPAPPVTRP